jgi:hypothetical protein
MYEIIDNFSIFDVIMFAVILTYGVAYGVRNYLVSISCIITGANYVQLALFTWLDTFWALGVIYFSICIFKIFG